MCWHNNLKKAQCCLLVCCVTSLLMRRRLVRALTVMQSRQTIAGKLTGMPSVLQCSSWTHDDKVRRAICKEHISGALPIILCGTAPTPFVYFWPWSTLLLVIVILFQSFVMLISLVCSCVCVKSGRLHAPSWWRLCSVSWKTCIMHRPCVPHVPSAHCDHGWTWITILYCRGIQTRVWT